MGTPSRTADPDFLPSLRLLVVRERYSMTDIGMMFGVTRERARQWCKQYGIESPDERCHQRGLFCVRVWDDVAHRFNPVSKGTVSAARKQSVSRARRQAMESRWEKTRTQIVAHAIRLKAALGRDPTLLEIANAVLGRDYAVARGDQGRAIGTLQAKWGGGGGAGGTKRRYQAMRAALVAAGVNVRSVGGTGHIDPEKMKGPQSARWKEVCVRGHLLAETRHPVYRYCVLCHRQHNRLSARRQRLAP